jgi:hypothetical protein
MAQNRNHDIYEHFEISVLQGPEKEGTGVYVGTGVSFALNLEPTSVYTPVALQ